MAWESIVGDVGEIWAVNPDGVASIIRAYCRSEALARQKIHKDNSPFPPHMYTVDVDWKVVRNEVDALSKELILRWDYSNSARLQFQTLVEYRAQTLANEATFHRLMQSATHQTFESMDKAVSMGESGVKYARMVRDGSAAIVVAGATVVTGGGAAGLGLLAAGSGLKGLGKYQDTGNVGAAAIEASTEFVGGIFDLGPVSKAIAGAGSVGRKIVAKIVVVQLQGQLQAVKTLAEGGEPNLKKAVAAAAAKAGFSIAGDAIFDKISERAVPIVAKLVMKHRPRALSFKSADALARGGIATVTAAKNSLSDRGIDRFADRFGGAEKKESDGPNDGRVFDHQDIAASATLHHLADTAHALDGAPSSDVSFVSTVAMCRESF